MDRRKGPFDGRAVVSPRDGRFGPEHYVADLVVQPDAGFSRLVSTRGRRLGMHDVAEFLKAHEPFSGLDEADLDRLAERAKVEFFTAGTVIFSRDQPPPDEIRVIRRGAVELVERGRVLDLLEEGDTFGQAWMFSGLPTGWEARAREDTLCYALAADDVVPLLSGPAGLRFVARSLLMLPRPGEAEDSHFNGIDSAQQPAEALITERPVICEPSVSLREAARRMVETGASSVMVGLEDGEFGILTDHDLRSRVVAQGLSLDSPVRDVLTTPVFTARPDQPATELMLAMLGHGIRHLPVLSATDEVLGVVTDRDLLAAQARTPFVLRRAIADAGSAEELGEAAAQPQFHRDRAAPGWPRARADQRDHLRGRRVADRADDRARRRDGRAAADQVRLALAWKSRPAGGRAVLRPRLRDGLG